MAEIEVRDRADMLAELIACESCSAPTLLRIAGLCADCIAGIGLAADRTAYEAWRRRVSEEIERRATG
ncbi:hypothetical protein H7X46_11390 [Pseudonocardia sp. C8]|uniref:hypothetical protein n=1 Tax=Pseudonocardia sp. C8 TaxID=2762759 RepID=UPI001642D471|nr:hypothetical protein [Pseudonocardia sp. C8]MBC3191664.1 hypothetical protein [Pseudonocardia sp. C8]